MSMKLIVADHFSREFGPPLRDVVKVKSWDISPAVGVVLQMDQPKGDDAAFVWLPYPREGQPVPEIALEYPGEAGRHSGTYPALGLKRGEPALKLTIKTLPELDAVVGYVRAMAANSDLPEVKGTADPRPRIVADGSDRKAAADDVGEPIDPASMPKAEPVKRRREAIPRNVQREVWQRDGGRCVECSTRESLCFDHIIPFSRGGSNAVRNLQLLCERCNLSKGNRL